MHHAGRTAKPRQEQPAPISSASKDPLPPFMDLDQPLDAELSSASRTRSHPKVRRACASACLSAFDR